jgi:ABC-type amino acid transport substrate-binding protein
VVEAATTHQAFVEQIVRPRQAPLIVFTRAETLSALTDRTTDAALLDLPTALAIAQSDQTFEVIAQFVTDQHLVIALPKGSTNLESVNVALRNFEASGRLRQFAESDLYPALGANTSNIPVITARTTR